MDKDFNGWKQKAKKAGKTNKKLLKKFQNKRNKGLEKLLPELHEEAFSHINCLECANCCKTISPRYKAPDRKRIAKHLGMKESEFTEKYLRIDEDGDYVNKTQPCPFLGDDNYCSIYDVRPRDCRKYPHTDSSDFIKHPHTTFKNSTTCPAVYYVLEKLKEKTN